MIYGQPRHLKDTITYRDEFERRARESEALRLFKSNLGKEIATIETIYFKNRTDLQDNQLRSMQQQLEDLTN